MMSLFTLVFRIWNFSVVFCPLGSTYSRSESESNWTFFGREVVTSKALIIQYSIVFRWLWSLTEFCSASETNDSEIITNMWLPSSGEKVLLLNVCLFWGLLFFLVFFFSTDANLCLLYLRSLFWHISVCWECVLRGIRSLEEGDCKSSSVSSTWRCFNKFMDPGKRKISGAKFYISVIDVFGSF